MSHLIHQFITVTILLNSVWSTSDSVLSLIHFNDFHARYEPITNLSTTCTEEICIGGFSRLYSVITTLIKERPNPILLNAGDSFKGTLWYNVHSWNITQHFLNKLPLDALTLGNHEFDEGISGVIPFLRSLHAPVVIANIDDSNEPMFQNLYKKSVVIQKAGKQIGIIGVISATTNTVSRTEKLIFRDESTSVNAEAGKLEKKGVFTNIVLSHCGYEDDLEIARKSVSKISLIVGGHTDTFLYTGAPVPGPDKPSGPYPTVVLNKDGKKVLVVQASAYTKYVGNLTVVYDHLGNIVEWHGAPIFLNNSFPTNSEIDKDLEQWKVSVDIEGSKVIGNTLFAMPNRPCRSEECLLGNFATDAMIAHYLKISPNYFKNGSVIALIHAGGMRAGIEKGNITFNELVSTFPFGDMIDSFDIKGIHLKNIFESHIDDKHLKSPHLFQISGLRVIFNITNPEGQRVQSLQVLRRKQNITSYENIVLDDDYKILLPTFLSESNFNPLFKIYLKNKNVIEQDLKVYTEYLTSKWPLVQRIENRIVVEK